MTIGKLFKTRMKRKTNLLVGYLTIFLKFFISAKHLCTPCYNGFRVVRRKGVNRLQLGSRIPLNQPVVADQGTKKQNRRVYYCVQKSSPLDASLGHTVQSVLSHPVALLPSTKRHSHLHVNSLHKDHNAAKNNIILHTLTLVVTCRNFPSDILTTILYAFIVYSFPRIRALYLRARW